MEESKNIKQEEQDLQDTYIANTYIIGSMEKTAQKDDGSSKREVYERELLLRNVYPINPCKLEKQKTTMTTDDLKIKMKGWVESGNWCIEENTWMLAKISDRIWTGTLKELNDIFKIKTALETEIYLPTLDMKGNQIWVKINNINITNIQEGSEIFLSNGQSIICTENHKFPVRNNYCRKGKNMYLLTPKFKLTKDLTIGDCLYYLHKINRENEIKIYDYIDGFAIGFYLAEGNKTKDCNKFNINLSCHRIKDVPYLDIIQKKYKLYFLPDKRTKYNLRVRSWDNNYRNLIEKFTKGSVSYDKSLTKEIYNQSEEFLKGIVEGFGAGDAHYDIKGKTYWFSITVKNQKLKYQLLLICKILGLQMRIYNNSIGGFDKPTIKQNFIINNKYEIKNKVNDILYIAIEKIIKVTNKCFYNIEVDKKYIKRQMFSISGKYCQRREGFNHLFAIGNGIISHNSLFNEKAIEIWCGSDLVTEEGLIHIPGDMDYVRMSDWITCVYNKGDSPVGTFFEIGIAMYFKIPVYLITDVNKTNLPKSLLQGIAVTKGEIFYNSNQYLEFIDKEYGLKRKEPKEEIK